MVSLPKCSKSTSDQAQAIFDELWDYYAQPESWRLYDDAKELIDYLNSSGLALGNRFELRRPAPSNFPRQSTSQHSKSFSLVGRWLAKAERTFLSPNRVGNAATPHRF